MYQVGQKQVLILHAYLAPRCTQLRYATPSRHAQKQKQSSVPSRVASVKPFRLTSPQNAAIPRARPAAVIESSDRDRLFPYTRAVIAAIAVSDYTRPHTHSEERPRPSSTRRAASAYTVQEMDLHNAHSASLRYILVLNGPSGAMRDDTRAEEQLEMTNAPANPGRQTARVEPSPEGITRGHTDLRGQTMQGGITPRGREQKTGQLNDDLLALHCMRYRGQKLCA